MEFTGRQRRRGNNKKYRDPLLEVKDTHYLNLRPKKYYIKKK
jgi:hypothetical protein